MIFVFFFLFILNFQKECQFFFDDNQIELEIKKIILIL